MTFAEFLNGNMDAIVPLFMIGGMFVVIVVFMYKV